MGGVLGGIAKMATGAGGGLGSAILSGTKTGKLLGAFGGSGGTPNPFGGLLNQVPGTGSVAPFSANVPVPGQGFNAFTPPPVNPTPTPQVERGGYLSPPANKNTAVAQTRQAALGPPNQNEAFAFNYFRNKNLSPHAAAGIMGNIAQESSFADDVLKGQRRGDQGASGFAAQWQGPRLRNLKAFAGSETPSFPQQLEFIFEEANPKSPYFDAGAARAMTLLQNAKSPAEAADIFRDHFERPSAEDRGSRRSFANQAFARYSGQPVTAVEFGTGTGTGVQDYPTLMSSRLFGGGGMTPGPLEQLQGGMRSGGGDQNSMFSGPQAQARRQAAMQSGAAQEEQQRSEAGAADLGAQDVAATGQSLTEKRLNEQQFAKQKKNRTPRIGLS